MGIVSTGLIAAMIAVVVLMGVFVRYERVSDKEALVIYWPRGRRVHFSNTFRLTHLSRVERVDLSVHTIEVEAAGDRSVGCSDYMRAELAIRFGIRIDPDEQAVGEVIEGVGAERASDPQRLRELLMPVLREGIETAAAQLEFNDLEQDRDDFRRCLFEQLRNSLLDGFVVEDIALNRVEPLPINDYNLRNFLQLRGAKKAIQQQD